MLALGLSRGFSNFWSPNFDSKPENPDAKSVTRPLREKPKGKEVRCKTMRALQRSLSEAQKIGVGVDALKGLIKKHKAACAKCRPSE